MFPCFCSQLFPIYFPLKSRLVERRDLPATPKTKPLADWMARSAQLLDGFELLTLEWEQPEDQQGAVLGEGAVGSNIYIYICIYRYYILYIYMGNGEY
jgi:hypothetical protein